MRGTTYALKIFNRASGPVGSGCIDVNWFRGFFGGIMEVDLFSR